MTYVPKMPDHHALCGSQEFKSKEFKSKEQKHQEFIPRLGISQFYSLEMEPPPSLYHTYTSKKTLCKFSGANCVKSGHSMCAMNFSL